LQAAEAEDYSDMNWDPDPIDAGPDFRANKPSDVVSTLVSIYDSRDLFVKELQVLLAQRLLAIKEDGYEKVDKEVLVSNLVLVSLFMFFQRRNIEILKIRFGEAALQVCEVMLKDMTDSKRIDQHIQTQKVVSATVAYLALRINYLLLVCGSSNNYIEAFLACVRVR
jgi:anaphase-promoting complex subunit 2